MRVLSDSLKLFFTLIELMNHYNQGNRTSLWFAGKVHCYSTTNRSVPLPCTAIILSFRALWREYCLIIYFLLDFNEGKLYYLSIHSQVFAFCRLLSCLALRATLTTLRGSTGHCTSTSPSTIRLQYPCEQCSTQPSKEKSSSAIS